MPPDSAWAKVFFVPVSCFLLFNIGDYIGRFLAGLVQWPRPGKVGSYVTLGLALLRSVEADHQSRSQIISLGSSSFLSSSTATFGPPTGL